MALLERLKDCARLRVWTEDDFKLSHDTLREVRIAERLDSLLQVHLPYGDRERSVRVDILVFDEARRSLNAYNVKRGNGSYDGGKRRLIHQELVRTQMLLTDYGRGIGLSSETSNAHVIFYYGLLWLPPPLAISGDDLDEHFQFPVHEAIELVNAYFVSRLSALIEQEEQPDQCFRWLSAHVSRTRKAVRSQYHLNRWDQDRKHFWSHFFFLSFQCFRKIHQSDAGNRSGESRPAENILGHPDSGAVNSPTCITPEYNEKIRPQPDRENAFAEVSGGETGIRTLGTLSRSTVFKTAAFDHSATSPVTQIELFCGLGRERRSGKEKSAQDCCGSRTRNLSPIVADGPNVRVSIPNHSVYASLKDA